MPAPVRTEAGAPETLTPEGRHGLLLELTTRLCVCAHERTSTSPSLVPYSVVRRCVPVNWLIWKAQWGEPPLPVWPFSTTSSLIPSHTSLSPLRLSAMFSPRQAPCVSGATLSEKPLPPLHGRRCPLFCHSPSAHPTGLLWGTCCHLKCMFYTWLCWVSCVVVACLPCWNVSPPLKAGPGFCFCGLAHVRFPVNSSASRHPGRGEVKHGSPPTSLCSPESLSKSHTTERQFVRSDATSDSQHRPRTQGARPGNRQGQGCGVYEGERGS